MGCWRPQASRKHVCRHPQPVPRRRASGPRDALCNVATAARSQLDLHATSRGPHGDSGGAAMREAQSRLRREPADGLARRLRAVTAMQLAAGWLARRAAFAASTRGGGGVEAAAATTIFWRLAADPRAAPRCGKSAHQTRGICNCTPSDPTVTYTCVRVLMNRCIDVGARSRCSAGRRAAAAGLRARRDPLEAGVQSSAALGCCAGPAATGRGRRELERTSPPSACPSRRRGRSPALRIHSAAVCAPSVV